MVRTQIQLTKRQAEILKRMAAEQDVSVAELIRRSVDALIASANGNGEDKRAQKRRAIELSGRFRSGVKDLGVNHDHYLAEDFLS